MQRIVILLVVLIIGFGSYKLGMLVAENNTRSAVLQKMEGRQELVQVQNIAKGVNNSGTMRAEVFVELTSVSEGLLGIKYTVTDKAAEVYEAEPQRYYYELKFDKQTKEVQEMSPYARPVN